MKEKKIENKKIRKKREGNGDSKKIQQCYGHVVRRDDTYIRRKVMEMKTG